MQKNNHPINKIVFNLFNGYFLVGWIKVDLIVAIISIEWIKIDWMAKVHLRH